MGAAIRICLFFVWTVTPLWATDCSKELEKGTIIESEVRKSLRALHFRSVSRLEAERVLIEIIRQTGLNPTVPDYWRLRDGSKIFLAVPATVGQDAGVLHLSYDVYRFESLGRAPQAVVSHSYFISEVGVRNVVHLTKDNEGAEFSLSSGLLTTESEIYASLGSEIVSPYLEFLRPFASSRMSDGSMVPAHRMSQLAHVRSLADAQNLRHWARIVNMKNFLVEACKRYGLYTVLGLTGVRQLLLSLQEEDTPTEQEVERLEALEEKLKQLIQSLAEQGFEVIEDNEGNFSLKRKTK